MESPCTKPGERPENPTRTKSIAVVFAVMILSVGEASAFHSAHEAVSMVWNAGTFDCEAVPMTLVDDGLWECLAPIPSAEIYYLQFWPGSGQDPKYGADLQNPTGLVLDDDPSQVPVLFSEPGYHIVRLDENVPSFTVVGAPGSIVVSLTYADDPIILPADASVMVLDQDFSVMLGSFSAGGGAVIDVVNLVPGRTYQLTVTASGYQDELRSIVVPDSTPVPLEVILNRLVANQNSTWSGLKALYR